MENIKIIAEYLKTKNVITFGGINDEAFLYKLPNKRNSNLSILFTENKNVPQQNSFNNKRLSYENRSTQIYIFSSDLNTAKTKATAIYEELFKTTKLNDRIFNIKLQNPMYLDQDEETKDEIFIVELDYNFSR